MTIIFNEKLLDKMLLSLCYDERQFFLQNYFGIPNNKRCRECGKKSNDLFCPEHLHKINKIIKEFVLLLECNKKFLQFFEFKKGTLSNFYNTFLEDYKNTFKKGLKTECLICFDIKTCFKFECCGFYYCKKCILKWLKTNHNCPICRKFFFY